MYGRDDVGEAPVQMTERYERLNSDSDLCDVDLCSARDVTAYLCAERSQNTIGASNEDFAWQPPPYI